MKPSFLLLALFRICFFSIFLLASSCGKDDDLAVFQEENPTGEEPRAEEPDTEEPDTEEPDTEEPDIEKPEDLDLGPLLFGLNSGGGELIYGDEVFLSDRYFNASSSKYLNPELTEIDSTDMDDLYLTERAASADLDTLAYNIPITNGKYFLKLHFAEIYFGVVPGSNADTNARIFNVSAEGKEIVPDFSIAAKVGPATAWVDTLEVEVQDQELSLEFVASANKPKLSGLQIYGNGEILPSPEASCSWQSLASSSLAKVESQSAKIGTKLYTFAGFLENLKITPVTEIYDITSDSWSLGAPMPTPVTHMGTAVVGNEVWIVGGFVGDHPGAATEKVQIYDPVSDSWREGPALPNPRGSGAAVYNNGTVHFFGGLLPDRVTDVGEHYTLDIENMNEGWNLVASLPNPRNHLSGCSVNGKVYAIGGQYGHDAGVSDQKFMDVYDPATDEWTRLQDLPSARSHFEPGTVVYGDKIIIVGGRRGNFFFDEVTAYDTQTDSWEQLCALPEKLLAPVAIINEDTLIVSNGGINGDCCPTQQTLSISLID